MENLKALVYKGDLTPYQRALAQREFKDLAERLELLEKAVKNNAVLSHVSVSLPSTDELYLKAKHYTDVQCNLQNFFDEDEIEICRMRYMHGYEQAIKDFVNCNYNPDLQ